MSGSELESPSGFSLRDLEYDLPAELIAQSPLAQRDAARMLVVDRAGGGLRDGRIADLPGLLSPGDLLVLNDTKVLPAKFAARRGTGGRVPGLFLSESSPGEWCVLLEGSRRLRVGEVLEVDSGSGDAVSMKLLERVGEGQWRVRVGGDEPAARVLERIGRTPLPPYIRRGPDDRDEPDRDRYQTVYARRVGAIAAPTAGLHLTESLLAASRARGVEVAFVTLHIGVGTFKPIAAAEVSQHVMHAERYELPQATADAVRACRARGGAVVAVGTTSVRVLESSAAGDAERGVRAGSGETRLFIYPPYSFRVVDGLLTNFHLPQSTLLALVMAFAGMAVTKAAYRHAVDGRYRFYSYGDAMFVR